jgi:hypothetical protein
MKALAPTLPRMKAKITKQRKSLQLSPRGERPERLPHPVSWRTQLALGAGSLAFPLSRRDRQKRLENQCT